MFAARFATARFVNVASKAHKQAVRSSHAMGTPLEMRQDTVRWKNITIVMVGLTSAACVYSYIYPEVHQHQRADLPYWHNRVKPLPWKSCPKCGLLEFPCWIECRKEAAEKAAEEAAAAKGHH